MHDARSWSGLQLVPIFSLVLLVLVGCGEKGGAGGGTATGGVSRVTLRIVISSQEISAIRPRAALPGQTRQTENLRLLRVDVSGAGISGTVRVDCPLPAGSAQCQVTETADAITVVIELTVPSGTGRQVAVTGFDRNRNIILSSTTTIDLTGAVQNVSVTLHLVTGSSGGPSALHGSEARSVDDDPLTFAWTLLTRPAGSQALVLNPTDVSPILVVDRPGTYTVQLTVTNGQMDGLPDVVMLHTVDVDGHALALAWSLVTMPVDSQAMGPGATTITPTFVVDSLGTYVVQLIMAE